MLEQLDKFVLILKNGRKQFLQDGTVSDDVVMPLFLAIIAALFLISLGFALFGKGRRFVASTPNLLVSVGILGTFVGIVIGLQEFDIREIDTSIKFLLAGLKIAFITSIAGMLGSIAFRVLLFIPPFAPRGRSAGKDIGPALLDFMHTQGKQLEALRMAIAGDEESSLAGQIKLFRNETKDRHDVFSSKLSDAMLSQDTQLKALHSAIVGDEESSLAGQIKLFRSDMGDRHAAFVKELWSRLTEFAEMMSKSATEQVINALKEVIADFNAKLTEQFGENFKELNAAVHRLVEWQENYRVQLEQMGEQYKQGVNAITKTEASVARISESTEKIPQAMKLLEEVLVTNQHQIEELSRHLQTFADARDKAVEAVPELQKQVEATVTNISNATQQLVAGINESTEQAKVAITAGAEELGNNVQLLSVNLTNTSDALAAQTEKIREQLGDVVGDINSAAREMMTNLKEAGEQVQNDTKVIQKEFSDSMANTAKEMDNNAQLLSANLTNTSDTLAEQTEKIHEQLGNVVGDINSVAREMMTSLKESGEQVQNDTKEMQKAFADSIDAAQKNLKSEVQEVFENLVRELNSMFDGLRRVVTETTERTGESVSGQLKTIDEAMTREIEEVMSKMAAALVQVTGKFTHDYTEMVDKMQKVINYRGDRK